MGEVKLGDDGCSNELGGGAMTVLSRAIATFIIVAVAMSGALLTGASRVAAGAKDAGSAALIMIEEPGCPYCALWHKEIGSAYPRTDEGRFAPLTTYFDSDPDADRFKRVAFSPTFIVVRDGREIGRIIGYPGEHFFWPMLDRILAKIGYAPEKLARRKKAP